MGCGRVVSAAATAAAVCGCAAMAVSMARAAPDSEVAGRQSLPSYTASGSVPAYRVVTPGPHTGVAATTSAPATGASGTRTTSAPAVRAGSPPATTSTHPSAARRTAAGRPQVAATSAAARAARPAPRPTPHSTAPAPEPRPAPRPKPAGGSALPLPNLYTGSAAKVITVVAHSYGSTTATLQAWTHAPGPGWFRYGPAVTAHVGSQGLTTSPGEWKSATPVGSFSLTQAFGAYSDPGTPLPYFTTDAADWWISQSGSLYNTHQRCWSGCPFTRGSPNEHLRYESPYYNYAVVIDYNRWPVRQGAGSAFFLHVTDGGPTAGCVAIPQSNLVTIMRWLSPSTHPRILIGVT